MREVHGAPRPVSLINNRGKTRRKNGKATTTKIEATLSTRKVLEGFAGFRNHAFVKLQDDYFEKDIRQWLKEGSFRNSVDLVDCYIDIALNEGWMDDDLDEPFR